MIVRAVCLAAVLASSIVSGADAPARAESCRAALEASARPTATRRELRTAADACREAGELTSALSIYERLSTADASDTEAGFWTGTLRRRLGDIAGARRAFDAVLAVNPGHVDALVGSARVALREGDLDRAERDLGRAAEWSPRNGEVAEVRGSLLRRQGRPEAAAEAFRGALETSPGNVDAQIGLARTENALGHPDRALSLAEQALAERPDSDEALTVAARSLESLGREREAHQAFRDVQSRQPTDEEIWRGLWRTSVLARPTLEARFRHYDSRVIEGRGGDESSPIRTRYSGYRLTEMVRVPLSDDTAWTLRSEQFEDELDQETAGITIYDVAAIEAETGLEHRPAREWSITASAGGAGFDSRTEDPVDREAAALARASLRWSPSAHGLDAEVGYRRGYLFGRSLGGDFDFAILAEDRFSARFEKALGDAWTWRGSGSLVHYSDGTEPILAAASLGYAASRFTATVYGDFSPLQTYFLKDDDELDFVDVSSLGARLGLTPTDWLELRGGGRGSIYSDSNDEAFGWAELWLRPRVVPFVRVGMRAEGRNFQRTSRSYSSYDYGQWGPVVGIGATIVPHVDFDVEYAHGFRDEPRVAPFDEDLVRGSVEVFCHPWLRAGVDGEWAEDGLPQRRHRIGAFARVIF